MQHRRQIYEEKSEKLKHGSQVTAKKLLTWTLLYICRGTSRGAVSYTHLDVYKRQVFTLFLFYRYSQFH